MEVGLQLYTLRHLGGLGAQLKLAAQEEYNHVETIGFHGLEPDVLAETIRHNDFKVPSAHFDIWEFEDDFGKVLATLEALKCKQAVMPWLPQNRRPKDRKGWEDLGKALAGFAGDLERAGVSLGYHNHDFDLAPVEGTTGLDIIMAHPEMFWQPDTGWVVASGMDLAAMIDRYSGRIPSVHAKDVDPSIGSGDEIWRDAGEGLLDWPDVLRRLCRAGCQYLFVEHDETPDAETTLNKGRSVLVPLVRALDANESPEAAT